MSIRKIEPKTEEHLDHEVGTSGKKVTRKIFPNFRFQHEFFPETKSWEVGKEYIVTLKMKMTGLSISRFQNDSEFDIIGFEDKSSGRNSDHNSDHG